MNGLLRGPDRVITRTGDTIPLESSDITDAWGTGDDIELALSTHADHFQKREGERISAHIQGPRGRIFLHRTDNDPWGVPRLGAADTLRLLDRLSNLLGVRALHYSPQSRGLSILDFQREKYPDRYARELPSAWDHRDTAVSPNFTRKQTDWTIIDRWHLHKWDTRAAWLASARTVPVGFGGVVRVPTFDPTRPALWPVDFPRRNGRKKGETIGPLYPVEPSPIMVPGWYSTEIVRAAQHHGQALEIGPGQGWTGGATTMRAFCDRLYSARAKVGIEGRTVAEQEWLTASIKRIYTRTFGCLEAFRKSREKLYQPHWYYGLRAEAARRMWKLYDSNMAYIIGLEVDTIYAIAPPDVSPRDILPQGSPDAYNPGTIRYEGHTPITRDMYNLFGQKGSRMREYLEDTGTALLPWEIEA